MAQSPAVRERAVWFYLSIYGTTNFHRHMEAAGSPHDADNDIENNGCRPKSHTFDGAITEKECRENNRAFRAYRLV